MLIINPLPLSYISQNVPYIFVFVFLSYPPLSSLFFYLKCIWYPFHMPKKSILFFKIQGLLSFNFSCFLLSFVLFNFFAYSSLPFLFFSSFTCPRRYFNPPPPKPPSLIGVEEKNRILNPDFFVFVNSWRNFGY